MIKKDALIIRKLNISDAFVVQRLIDEIFSVPPWNDDWKAEELRAYTAELLGGGTALCFGLFDRTELAGIALGRTKTWWEGKEYVLEEFGIVENLRGKRAGAYFMAEVERLAAAEGCAFIVLQTERTAPAYEFYKKAGFTESAGSVMFVKSIGGGAERKRRQDNPENRTERRAGKTER